MTNRALREEGNTTQEDEQLIERMVENENILEAYTRVVRNKGSAGVDGMTVEEMKPYLHENWLRIKTKLLTGKYKPQRVRLVEIPKANGGVRQLGIPTVVDRMIQQALHQVLSPIFEKEFSESSYGFRAGRSAHHAVLQAQQYQESGKKWVVDLDLEKFFDEVNHDILMSKIAKKVKDKKILLLVRGYLRAGIMMQGVESVREKGTPQGSPLSPLLSNIMLDELDKELERRGHTFCRYADDCNIYVRSEKAGKRVMDSITKFVERTLQLKVNKGKSAVDKPQRRKFLGYSFMWNGKLRVPRDSTQRFRAKLKTIFRKGRGRNLRRLINEDLNPVIRGWINYYRMADVNRFADELDGWIRRRLRLMLWLQWKRPWTRRRKLMKAGLLEEHAARSAFNQLGEWWNSGASHMNLAFPKVYFDEMGLVCLLDELFKFRKTCFGNRLGT